MNYDGLDFRFQAFAFFIGSPKASRVYGLDIRYHLKNVGRAMLYSYVDQIIVCVGKDPICYITS